MRKHKKNNSLLNSLPLQGKEAARAFTLVELIVVITILAILGTIAFISLQGYSASSRDSVRISDVSNMKTSLELFHLNAGKYPLPDNYGIVSYNLETLWYQGTFGSTVVSQLSRNINKIPKDSLSDKEYIYSVSNNKNEFQILNLLEGDLALNSINQTNAAGTSKRTPRIDGQYNGVFIKTTKDIVPTPSIITAEDITGGLTLSPTNIKSQIITGGKNIPNIGGVNSATGELDIILSVYNGTIDKDSTPEAKVLAMQAIQGAYTGSVLANSDIYAHILSKTSTGDLVALVDTVVLKNSTTTAPTIITYSDCEFNSEPVLHSTSVTAYELSTVSYGNTCTSEQRTCTDGVLDGTYTNTVCTVDLATGTFTLSEISVTQGTNVTITNNCSTQPTGYTSSNETVATISGNTITTLSAGTTDITPVGGACGDNTSKALTVNPVPNSCNSTQPTNATLTTGTPTSPNQARQSSNSSNPCYFTCSSGYGSTGTSCVTATNCGQNGAIEITLTNGQTWSCMNLGATTVRDGTTQPTNCGGTSTTNCNSTLTRLGNYYQRGRNDTGFTNGQAVSPYLYGWEAQNDTRWGGSTLDTTTSDGAGTTAIGRQGPCPIGWHVPSVKDWQTACNTILGTTCTNGMAYNSLIATKLRLPFAGYRIRNNGYYYTQSTLAYYWSSSPYSTYSYTLYFSTSNIHPANNNNRANGFSVRCLKN